MPRKIFRVLAIPYAPVRKLRRIMARNRRVFGSVSFSLFILLGALAAISMYLAGNASAGWYDANWLYREKITVNHNKVVGKDNLTNYVMLFVTTNSDIISRARSDGYDILFTDSSNNKLNHEIEYFSQSPAKLVAWVQIPSLSYSQDTNLYIYYGYASATNQESVSSTWASNFTGVWHMSEDPSITTDGDCGGSTKEVCDSTGNSFDGDSNGSMTSADLVDGTIDGAIDFDSNDYLDVGGEGAALDFNGASAVFSICAWAKPSLVDGNHHPIVMKGDQQYGLKLFNGNTWEFVSYGGSHSSAFSDSSATAGVWTYLCGTHTGGYNYLWVNGVKQSTPASYTTVSNGTYNVNIGRNAQQSTRFFNGQIDEVRVLSAAVTDGWVQTSFNNQSNPNAFYTINNNSTPSAYWKFDEGVDNTCSGGTNDACDSTGNTSNDGALTSTTWQNADYCISGSCMKFDGSTSVVTVTNNNSIDLDEDLAREFTIGAWVRPNSDGEGSLGEIFQKGSNTYCRTSGESGTSIDLACSLDLATTDATVTVTGGLTKDTWQYVSLTYTDDADDEISVYVNGVLKGTSTNGVGSPSADANNLLIGGSTTANFHGFIDEMKIYSFARDEIEIKSDMAARASEAVSATLGTDKYAYLNNGLAGYWNMNDNVSGDAQTIADKSGNGSNGTTVIGGNGTGMDCTVIGKFDGGCNLDGTDDYISVADSGATDTLRLGGTSNLTISSWVNIANLNDSAQHFIYSKYDWTNGQGYAFKIAANGKLIGNFNGNVVDNTTSSAYVTAGSWYQLTMVIKDGQTMQFFVNGVLKESFNFTPTTLTAYTSTAGIGTASDGLGNTLYDLSGKMDELRIYNRALSGDEISKLYDWGPSAAVRYKMDEQVKGDAKTIYDTSGNAKNAATNDGANNTGMDCTVAGKYGPGCGIDGIDDYIDVPSGVGTWGKNASWGGWFKMNHLPSSTVTIIGNFDNASSNGNGMDIHVTNAGTIRYELNENGNVGGCNDANRIVIQAASALTLGRWYHVFATIDYAGGTTSFYIDGVFIGSASISGFAASGCGLSEIDSIAGNERHGSTVVYLDGTVDNMAVYKYALTPAQVQEEMMGGVVLGASDDTQTIHWKFDEYTGTTANNANSSQSALTGAISGATWKAGTNCKYGACLDIDTATDTVSAGDVAFTDSLPRMSISMWMKPSTIAINKEIISKFGASGQYVFRIRSGGANSDELNFYIASSTNAAANYYSTTNLDLANGTWVHLAFVYDGTAAATERIKVYKNGRQVSGSVTGTIPTSLTTGTTSNLILGNGDNADITAMLATYDDVKIYSAALTRDDVVADMNANAAVNFGTGTNERANVVDGAAPAPEVYINFDGNTGTPGTITDKSTNGHDMSAQGSMTANDWVPGKYGSALRFDGVDDHLDFATNIDTYTSTSGFTLMAWIYWTGGGTTNTIPIFSDNQTNGNNHNSFIIHDGQSDKLYYDTFNHGVASTSGFDSTFVISPYTWTFVAVTFNDSNDQYTIYKNGDYQLSSTGLYEDDVDGIRSIGASSNSGNLFKGRIDDAKIFTSYLTPAQVLQEYNRGGPIGWWKFDECLGDRAYDSSGFGSNGNIYPGDTSGANDTVGTCGSGITTEMRSNGASGKRNAALDFDGTNDYVDLGVHSEYEFAANKSFSVSAWVNRQDTPSGSGEFIVFYGGTEAQWYALQSIDSLPYDDYVFSVDDNTTKTDCAFNLQDSYDTSNKWVHITGIRNLTDGKLYVYADGRLVNSCTDSTTGTINNSTYRNTYVGVKNASGTLSQYYDGQIDDVRIYNYPLSTAQVRNIMNEGAARFGPSSGIPQ